MTRKTPTCPGPWCKGEGEKRPFPHGTLTGLSPHLSQQRSDLPRKESNCLPEERRWVGEGGFPAWQTWERSAGNLTPLHQAFLTPCCTLEPLSYE